MENDFTQHHGLPLPHPSNELQEDVPRLRQALTMVDAKLHSLDMLLQSDDVDLNEVKELVAAIKANKAFSDDLLQQQKAMPTAGRLYFMRG